MDCMACLYTYVYDRFEALRDELRLWVVHALSALPLHYMSSLGLHKTVIKAIDRRRRAFFWTGDDSCHGSKCLVAWEHVCTSKLEGGLGLKDLDLQNRCLLMKFVDKMFSGDPAPWKDWIMRTHTPLDEQSAATSFLWNIVHAELDTYRSITKVEVHNGVSASFLERSLATQWPHLPLSPCSFLPHH